MARKKRPTKPRKDLHQQITDRIVAILETGTIPWNPGYQGVPSERPLRHTGEPYNGINTIMLWAAATMRGFMQPRWMTYNQAQDLGGQVRKGESGELVVYANKFTPRAEKENADQNDDKPARVGFLKGYTVFNVCQIDGLPDEYYEADGPTTHHSHERNEHIDAFYANTGMTIRPMTQGSPGFLIDLDVVEMPELHLFENVGNYYHVLNHEAIHWTGHHDRLARDQVSIDESAQQYAKEELIADIGAAFLAAEFGLDIDYKNHTASYIEIWLSALRHDNKFIFQAASHATKAVESLHALQPKSLQGAA